MCLTRKECIKLRTMLLDENREFRREANRLLGKPAGSRVADRAWLRVTQRINDNTATIGKLEQMAKENSCV